MNRVTQAVVVEQESINRGSAVQRIALFGPDGEPLLLGGGVTSGQLDHLKGRVTKLEKRLDELEGNS
jgi:hypothetical protein